MEKTTAFLQKWRVRLGHLFTLGLLISARPERLGLLIGTIVTLLGLAIRMAAAGCIRKDQSLARTGPYAFTRNPLYLGSFFMMLGFCVACGNLWVAAAFVPFFFLVYYSTIWREERFLSGKFGGAFAAFKAAVPRFLPRLTPADALEPGWFKWSRAMDNHEYEGAIAALMVLALLWAMNLTNFTLLKALLK